MPVAQRPLWPVVAAVVVSALSVVFPLVGLVSMIAVLLVSITQQGKPRMIVAVVGGLLSTVGMARFVIEEAVPGIVQGGQRSAEEKAASRLREILWAERRALELKVRDDDKNGVPEFVPMAVLTDPNATGGNLILSPVAYRDLGQGAFQAEGYAYRVFLPEDAAGTEKHFIAYAWPMLSGAVGRRAFMLDEVENICETRNVQGYSGVEKMPQMFAAMESASFTAPRCERTLDSGAWKPWKKKVVKPVQ